MKRGPRYRIRNPAELVERQSARGWWSRLPDGSGWPWIITARRGAADVPHRSGSSDRSAWPEPAPQTLTRVTPAPHEPKTYGSCMNFSQRCNIRFNQQKKVYHKTAIAPYVRHRFANVILMP